MASRTAVVKWLLDADPAIRWQVLRDVKHAPAEEVVAAERARVAAEGWGAGLLALAGRRGLLGRRGRRWLDDHQWTPSRC